ncbi:ABC transporter substrate-binding protein [Flavivirga aquatica]|uniref:ABC transporter substrate-binding protein n=1 Tax=Flavivirga aquatica TaxID=1849968 RepID=A0A1E5TBH5_9FLAO|nr:ABC transporter substrate-binding protein [Flavivirga aquatica]OEK08708.1 ABC transporter substrate-binding protein [Flavivirga aquatica]
MRFIILFFISLFLLTSCKEDKGISRTLPPSNAKKVNIKYAKGFKITHYKTYKEILVTSPWPKSEETYRYIIVEKEQDIPKHNDKDVIIKTPIEKIVVMSTTNIPALEYLGIENKLVGFPNTKFISSPKTRTRIDKGEIKDLNNDLELNIELLLDLQPQLVIGFSINGNNKKLDQVEKLGIPVVLNGSWTEEHPLGRSEWIKFIAAFFNKDKEADSIFNTIESNYLKVKATALKAKEKPIVFSGSMFKDVWNIPGGHSYFAKYLEDANTNYLWKDNKDNGSLHLNFENVLSKGQKAELWIGAGSFKSKAHLIEQHKGYSYFDAFKNNKIYTYTNKVGPKGGLLYYELGPVRPDIILKDIINIAHPGLLTDYESFFFKRLE